jgi:hypothetical protein
MTICEFCTERKEDGACGLGLRIPKKMTCRSFETSLESFCSKPSDFVGVAQLLQMAAFFDIHGQELAKVRAVAELAYLDRMQSESVA